MALSLRRRKKKSTFKRASDGSMSLMEHFQDLRTRLFKASLGLVGGVIIGMIFAKQIQDFINAPYCEFDLDRWIEDGNSVESHTCQFNVNGPLDDFLLQLKIGLFAGIILSAPIWLYQLWAFIAPGLHRNERRYSYVFATIAGPLFAAGATLGFFVISKSLIFFLGMSDDLTLTPDLTGYFDFVTNVMLLFGAGFEFPLIVVLLNIVGLASAKRLLSWWRVAVFLVFLFCAIVTPTPDPFGMTALALPMCGMYFAAVGFAFLNDRRRARKNQDWDSLDPDEASTLDDEPAPVVESADTGSDNLPQRRRDFDSDAT